jgi:ribosome recycling factor
LIRLFVRPDEAKRKSLARDAAALCENFRGKIRNVRHRGQKDLKDEVKQNQITKDDERREMKKVGLDLKWEGTV